MAVNNSINLPIPVPITSGGTGRITSTTAYGVLCSGTTATGPIQTVAALGSTGQVLTSNGASALPSFQPAGTASALVFISGVTAANSANVTFTGLTTYSSLIVVIRGVQPVTTSTTLNMNVSVDGTTFSTTGYFSGVTTNPYNSSTFTNASSTSAVRLCSTLSSSASYSTQLSLQGLNTASPVIVSGQSTYLDGGGVVQSAAIGGYTPTGTVAIRFTMSSGNINLGRFAVYGLVSS